MSRIGTRFGILFAVLVFAGASAMAQSIGGGRPTPPRAPTMYTVTVNANVSEASVYIDGRFQGSGTPIQVQLPEGQHDVQVTAQGYSTWENTVNVNGNVVVNAVLRTAQFTMRVTSNVTGAAVVINGQQQGSTPFQVQVQPGRYNVQVSANGYTTWQNTVNISGDTVVNAELRAMQFTLQVNSNVTGAVVQVGGAPNGRTPYSAQVQPGTYVVTVTAPGYLPYTTSVTVNGNQVVQATLMPALATLRLQVPDRMLNPYMRNPMNQVTWFVDGSQVGTADSIQVDPGRHRIQIVSGGLSAEGNFVFQAGQTYVFDLTMQLDLRNHRDDH